MQTRSKEAEYFYSDVARVVFSMNTKSMSSSTRLLLYALDHDAIPDKTPSRSTLHVLKDAPLDKQAMILQNYTRASFVRHPYSRLVSAWANKFRDMPETCRYTTNGNATVRHCDSAYDFWVVLARTLLRLANVHPTPTHHADILRNVTWPVFLRAIQYRGAYNNHWGIQVGLRAVHATRCCSAALLGSSCAAALRSRS